MIGFPTFSINTITQLTSVTALITFINFELNFLKLYKDKTENSLNRKPGNTERYKPILFLEKNAKSSYRIFKWILINYVIILFSSNLCKKISEISRILVDINNKKITYKFEVINSGVVTIIQNNWEYMLIITIVLFLCWFQFILICLFGYKLIKRLKFLIFNAID